VANRSFTNQGFYLEKAPVFLFAKVSIGASGAPTLSRGKGISSISRTSAGLYVITLQDAYVALLGATCTRLLASGMPAAPAFSLVSETVSSTKAVTVQFSGATSSSDTTLVAADPSSGTVLYFQIVLSNSSAT
jgi:hypothetical protein